MKISTRGRYALRIIVELAQHHDENFLSLKEIARLQNMSTKYLESIVSILHKRGLVMSQRGKDGGYKLAHHPSQITVGTVLKLLEGNLAPISCLEHEPNTCERSGQCLTLPMWQELHKLIDDYLENITIEDLIQQQAASDPPYHI